MIITDLLQEYGVAYNDQGESPHVTFGWIGVECPWCGIGTGKTGLGIHLDSLSCKCWKCGRRSLYDVLKELTKENHNVLKGILGTLGRTTSPQILHRGRLQLPKGLGEISTRIRLYLQARGFDPDELVRIWGLQGIGLARRLAWRIFIPVTLRGTVVSWTTRSIQDNPDSSTLSKNLRRYVNAKPEEESVPIKSLLYGEDLSRHAIIVVEGPTDVWNIGPGAVATLGVSYTTAQVRRISRFPLRVVCFDNEKEAQKQAAKLCEELSLFPGRTVRVELDAKDPGSATQKEIARIRRSFLE